MTARSLEIEARLGDNKARAELYRRAEAARRSQTYVASFKKTRSNPDAEAPASTPAVRLTKVAWIREYMAVTRVIRIE